MTHGITSARAIPFSVPLTGGNGAPAGRREGWLLRVDSGPVTGWGEASPLPGFSAESLEETGHALRAMAVRLPGMRIDWSSPLELPALEESDLPPSARFAVELALLHTASREAGVPIARMLGAASRRACPVAALLAGPLASCVERAGEVVSHGFVAVKLKVGSAEPGRDADRVRAVARRLGDGVSIRLDANRAWSRGQALQFTRAIADLRIDFIEEPLTDPAELPDFSQETGFPVALDESLVGADPDSIAPFDGLRALVLKPTLLGGIRIARRFAARAMDIGASAVISASFETGVGLRGLAHLAASLPGDAVPAGLGTAAWLAGDTTTPPFPPDAAFIDLAEPFDVNVPQGRAI